MNAVICLMTCLVSASAEAENSLTGAGQSVSHGALTAMGVGAVLGGAALLL